MKTKNSGKSNDQQHGASKDENCSQEELLNLSLIHI